MPNPNIVAVGKATQFQPGHDPRRQNGRKPNPTLTEQLRIKLSAEADAILAAYIAALKSGDAKLGLAAADAILDRLDGRPTQRTEMSGGMTLEQLIADNPAEVSE